MEYDINCQVSLFYNKYEQIFLYVCHGEVKKSATINKQNNHCQNLENNLTYINYFALIQIMSLRICFDLSKISENIISCDFIFKTAILCTFLQKMKTKN